MQTADGSLQSDALVMQAALHPCRLNW